MCLNSLRVTFGDLFLYFQYFGYLWVEKVKLLVSGGICLIFRGSYCKLYWGESNLYISKQKPNCALYLNSIYKQEVSFEIKYSNTKGILSENNGKLKREGFIKT